MIERMKGFVIAQDSVHGKSTWKIRIDQSGHELNSRKCRAMSFHGDYEPKQSDNVDFVIGSKVEGGQTILLAHDVSPIVEVKDRTEVQSPQLSDAMNWIIIRTDDGQIYSSIVGVDNWEEIKKDYEDAGEELVAFVPFRISEHMDRAYDDPGIEAGFDVVKSLGYVEPTRDALEKLVTTLIREILKT
mgnify:CR=1 FL=1